MQILFSNSSQSAAEDLGSCSLPSQISPWTKTHENDLSGCSRIKDHEIIGRNMDVSVHDASFLVQAVSGHEHIIIRNLKYQIEIYNANSSNTIFTSFKARDEGSSTF